MSSQSRVKQALVKPALGQKAVLSQMPQGSQSRVKQALVKPHNILLCKHHNKDIESQSRVKQALVKLASVVSKQPWCVCGVVAIPR